ncbi:MAG TPA: tRNA lysidine(34) synthetase TilS [Arcobacter sp.]|nr:tRNA lysidine(34) synthetase TilS [Arcobacter sp.]HIP55842.1 tRNA lysidine(34) synthetase TilS [Arcobacter sp.]
MFDLSISTTSKNLLAFSAGVDSSALFFLLIEKNFSFDIVIVDYKQREQSSQEVQYAKDLALKYNKICYTKEYTNTENFNEKDARDFRYKYFNELIKKHSYNTLFTAHQLNDVLEWFFMQLSKGAGLNELIGLQKEELRENYTLHRPLLDISKDELENYLKSKKLKYFIDDTNTDIKYKRNYFRKEFSNKFIDEYKDGIKKSFDYLNNDINSLNNLYKSFTYQDIHIAKFKIYDENIMVRFIDKTIKKMGLIISKSTRDEIIRQKEIIISDKISVSIVNETIYISPFIDKNMDKKFKEKCRVLKIPKNIRPYLFSLEKNSFDTFISKLNQFL